MEVNGAEAVAGSTLHVPNAFIVPFLIWLLLCYRLGNQLHYTVNWMHNAVLQRGPLLPPLYTTNTEPQHSNLWWMPNTISRSFGTAMKTGSSRCLQPCPLTYDWGSSQLPFTVEYDNPGWALSHSEVRWIWNAQIGCRISMEMSYVLLAGPNPLLTVFTIRIGLESSVHHKFTLKTNLVNL